MVGLQLLNRLLWHTRRCPRPTHAQDPRQSESESLPEGESQPVGYPPESKSQQSDDPQKMAFDIGQKMAQLDQMLREAKEEKERERLRRSAKSRTRNDAVKKHVIKKRPKGWRKRKKRTSIWKICPSCLGWNTR